MFYKAVKREEVGRFILCYSIIVLIGFGAQLASVALQTIIVKRIGIEFLPYSYIINNSLSIAGVAFSWILGSKTSNKRVIYFFSITPALLLLMTLFIFINTSVDTQDRDSGYLIFAIIVVILARRFFGNTLWNKVWTTINGVFSFSQTRRLIPIFLTGNQIGSIVGGLLVQAIVSTAGMGGLIIDWALSFLLLSLLFAIFYHYYGHLISESVEAKSTIPTPSLTFKDVLRYVVSTRTTIALALINVFFAIVMTIKDFQYSQVINSAYSTEYELATFIGYFNAFMAFTTLVSQIFFSEKYMFYFGVFRSLMILPIVTSICFFFLTLHFGFWQGLLLYYCWALTTDSFQSHAQHMAFNSLSSTYRKKVRDFLGSFLRSLMGIAGAVFLLIYFNVYENAIDGAPTTLLSFIGMTLSLVWLTVVLYAQRFYIRDIISSLNKNKREHILYSLDAFEERRETLAYTTLKDIVRDSNYDLEIRAKAMEVLSRLGNIKALGILTSMLHYSHEYLRLAAVKALSSFNFNKRDNFILYFLKKKMEQIFVQDKNRQARIYAGSFILRHTIERQLPFLVDSLLRHCDPKVRIMAIESLRNLNIENVELLIFESLGDVDPNVRAEAIIALCDYEEYQSKIMQVLRELICSPHLEWQKAGLIAMLRSQQGRFPIEIVSPALSSDNLLIRSIALLVVLSSVNLKAELMTKYKNDLLMVIGSTSFKKADRYELFTLIPYIREDILDMLMTMIQQMPQDKRFQAQQGMEVIGEMLSNEMATSNN